MEDSMRNEYNHLSNALWKTELPDLGIRHNGFFSINKKEAERSNSAHGETQVDYQRKDQNTRIDNMRTVSNSNSDNKNKGTKINTDTILYNARENYIGGNFKPISLRRKDFLFFIRIQKTGSETMWKTLLNVFDGSHWDNNQKGNNSIKGGIQKKTCSWGMFCGEICQQRVENYLGKIDRGEEKCRFIMRGHIGIYDFYNAVGHKYDNYAIADNDITFFTILRDPVKRVLSEYTHITKNLVSQFGPKQYGNAWDYNYHGSETNIREFLDDCIECRIGSSNRQAKMLSGLFTTGANIDEVNKFSDDYILMKAKENLEAMKFIGLTERYTDSMLLLKYTFPDHLKTFNTYTYSKHPHDGKSGSVEEETIERIKELNRLDIELYDYAQQLFYQRFTNMLKTLSEEKQKERFVKVRTTTTYILKEVDQDTIEKSLMPPVLLSTGRVVNSEVSSLPLTSSYRVNTNNPKIKSNHPAENLSKPEALLHDKYIMSSPLLTSTSPGKAVSSGTIENHSMVARGNLQTKGDFVSSKIPPMNFIKAESAGSKAKFIPNNLKGVQQIDPSNLLNEISSLPKCIPNAVQPHDHYHVSYPSPSDLLTDLKTNGLNSRYEVMEIMDDLHPCAARSICLHREGCEAFLYILGGTDPQTILLKDKHLETKLFHVTSFQELLLDFVKKDHIKMQLHVRNGLPLKDPLEVALQRYDNAPYLQLSSARNMQASAYRAGDLVDNKSQTGKCKIKLSHIIESNALLASTVDTTLWETYEPVNAVSNYKLIERIEFGGVCVAKEECLRNPRCHGFFYLLGDGLSFLFTLKDQTEIVANTEGMPSKGNEGLYRMYLRTNVNSTMLLTKGTEVEINSNVIETYEMLGESHFHLESKHFQKESDSKYNSIIKTGTPQSIVVSLTTIPSRIGEVRDTLNTLIHQTLRPDHIFLNVPSVSNREKGTKYKIPEWLKEMEDDGLVTLVSGTDYGPATKLIPTVKKFHEEQPGTNHLILVVDDDTHYPPRLLETLTKWHMRLPNAALSLRGWVMKDTKRYLDIFSSYLMFGNEALFPHPTTVLTANCGYLVQSDHFDANLWDYTGVPDGAKWMDDVWINGHLSKNNVPRFVVPFDEDQFTYNSYSPKLTLDTSITISKKNGNGNGGSKGGTRVQANDQAIQHFGSIWNGDVMFSGSYRVHSDRFGIPK